MKHQNRKLGVLSRIRFAFSNNLSDIDLSGYDLSSVALSNKILIRANFQSANLSSANLEKSILEFANFQRANLSNAKLDYAKLREANFSESILMFSSFHGADLTKAIFPQNLFSGDSPVLGVNFRDANLIGANLPLPITNIGLSFEGAIMPDGKSFRPDVHMDKMAAMWLKRLQADFSLSAGSPWIFPVKAPRGKVIMRVVPNPKLGSPQAKSQIDKIAIFYFPGSSPQSETDWIKFATLPKEGGIIEHSPDWVRSEIYEYCARYVSNSGALGPISLFHYAKRES